MIIELLRSHLRNRDGSLEELANKIGVPYYTLVKVESGETENPKIETIEKIIDYYGYELVKTRKRK